MAGNSVIGALRVDLGLNSAQFVKGMKDASGGLKIFGVQLTYSLNGIAEQVGRLIGAFPEAIKGAIDHADALSKAAQKAGVTVEALSRLEYAAKFSDVSLEDLTGSLGKLSKTMLEAVAAPTSSAATAFKALGINITDATGKLRPANEVLSDIADRFSRLQDGSTKTALSMLLFGKSGAQLIPLLNSGASGLKQMADESDRLGDTISTKTAQAANKFNDSLTKLAAIFQGLVNTILPAILPGLNSITESLGKLSPQTVAVGSGIAAITVAAGAATPAIKALTASMSGLLTVLAGIAALPGGVLALAGGIFLGSTEPLAPGEDELVRRLREQGSAGLKSTPRGVASGASDATLSDLISGSFGALGSSTTFGSIGELKNALSPPKLNLDVSQFEKSGKAIQNWTDEVDGAITRAQAFAETIRDAVTGAFSGFIQEIEQGTDPLKAFADQLANIGNQLLNAGIQSLFSAIFTPNFIGGTFGAPALKLGFQTGIPGRAIGGPVSLGQPYMVGENGPELFTPGVSGSITPNSALGGGQSVVRVELGPELVGQVLKQAANQTVQIVKSNAPAAVTRSQLDHRRGG